MLNKISEVGLWIDYQKLNSIVAISRCQWQRQIYIKYHSLLDTLDYMNLQGCHLGYHKFMVQFMVPYGDVLGGPAICPLPVVS